MKKKPVSSHIPTAFISSKFLNVCKYMYERKNLQQLRRKLKKFNRRLRNRNGIMSP